MAIRYGLRLGCRFGKAHDFRTIHENRLVKWEVCQGCNVKKRYNKTITGRNNNTEYLKDHVRNFAQRNGATRLVYTRIYQPEKCIIVL